MRGQDLCTRTPGLSNFLLTQTASLKHETCWKRSCACCQPSAWGLWGAGESRAGEDVSREALFSWDMGKPCLGKQGGIGDLHIS